MEFCSSFAVAMFILGGFSATFFWAMWYFIIARKKLIASRNKIDRMIKDIEEGKDLRND